MTSRADVHTEMVVLPARSFKPRRYRPGNIGTWSGHLCFASDLIGALKPSLLVELGTHYGESYFGMCQAIQEQGIVCKSYAVDLWRGDPHTGFYDASVYQEVNAYNENNYAHFSTLLRTTFDDAHRNFSDQSIDLLHIDGLHTYEAVRHDFEFWLPKVRPGGIVLLHDILARHLDFGVWRLWEDLVRQFPHFEFSHDYGLGVVRKAGATGHDAELIRLLFSGSTEERQFLRHHYQSQADAMKYRAPVEISSTELPVQFRVYPNVTGYAEATSVVTALRANEWQHVVLELPQGSPGGRIRIDPAERPCVIQFGGLVLKRAVDGAVVCEWIDGVQRDAFTPYAELVLLPDSEATRFLSTGRDPQFLLPEIESAIASQPLVLEARVRITEDLAGVVPLIHPRVGSASPLRAGDDPERAALEAALEAKRLECEAALTRNQQLSAEVRNLQAERVAVVADYRHVHATNESLVNQLSTLISQRSADEARWRQERDALAAELNIVHHSRSWRLTAPLRQLFRALR